MNFRRVAVLNRGDAARRFIQSARELSDELESPLEIVAVFTDPDADAPFVELADDAVSLGAARQLDDAGRLVHAYCLPGLVIDRLNAAGCDAVWPGWGFAAEDADMVDRLTAAGMTFIGPPAKAIRALGDKVAAKQLATECGVPLAAWVVADLNWSEDDWRSAAMAVGLPLMVKVANGGGGRGIRRVDSADAVADAARAVRREAREAFGPGTVFLERCIEGARHVEVQFVVGADGVASTFGVRDCSVQRRHQKVIEETPSPVLPASDELRLAAATATLAETAGYRGVGTAEFLFVATTGEASFCEVNARLQVEHTITEAVWGVDLVRAQIDVALGRAHQRAAGPRGWAVEARLSAEDPDRSFVPTPGRVLVHRPPAGPHVRVDTDIRTGSSIPVEFDSLIAKVVAWGPTRDRAIATLKRALLEYQVVLDGGSTNRAALVDVLGREEFISAMATTTWLETAEGLGTGIEDGNEWEALLVGAVWLARQDRCSRAESWFAAARTAVPPPDETAIVPTSVELTARGSRHRFVVASGGSNRWHLVVEGHHVGVTAEPVDDGSVRVSVAGRPPVLATVMQDATGISVTVRGRLHRMQQRGHGLVCSPGPALLVSLEVQVGETISPGQRIGTLEAMKTESPLNASVGGRVDQLLAEPGTNVAAGQPIVRVSERAGNADPTSSGEYPGVRWAEFSSARPLLSCIDAVVVGEEVSVAECMEVVARLESIAATGDSSAGTPSSADLSARLLAVAEVESLFDRRHLVADHGTSAMTPDMAFHYLCQLHGERRGTGPVWLNQALRSLARRLGRPIPSDPCASDEATRQMLWRLAATRSRSGFRSEIVGALVSALASMARRGRLDSTVDAACLDAVEYAFRGTVCEAAVALRSELGLFVRDETEPSNGAANRRVPGHPGVVDPSNVIHSADATADCGDQVDEPQGPGPSAESVTMLRRSQAAESLRVVDPWALLRRLEGDDCEFRSVHPAMSAGHFVEHDLVAGDTQLVPVHRTKGEHSSGVIVGLIANPLPGRSEWTERVFIANDPLRSMGSLGEPECRRMIAALDLAETRSVPVEWISASAGARIAWDSGTENLDWTAAVLKRIVHFTAAGGTIHVIAVGASVGAQSYWNAEATMLMHTRGILVMTPNSSLVLTGRRALELSGSVGAADEVGIGGYDRIMGPNGQAQYRAADPAEAYAILFDHYALSIPDASGRAAWVPSTDPVDRDVTLDPCPSGSDGVRTIGDLLSDEKNGSRKVPFAMTDLMRAIVDRDASRRERWASMSGADSAIVWDTRIGGHPVALIGMESRPRARRDAAPVDGPVEWAAGTLYPGSSKKVARALRSASGNRAAVVLANLSGFDGSPESMRRLQLEYGAEIARAVVDFEGPIIVVVVGRYHGGAYVVFSKKLNDRLTALAVRGSFASVMGGVPAAAIVLTSDVHREASRDPAVHIAQSRSAESVDPQERAILDEQLLVERAAALGRARAVVARRFDEVHDVERAVRVGSLDAVIEPGQLRPAIVDAIERARNLMASQAPTSHR
jgi:acetyl/propionyl-CoA carboxylase alpha subunit/acetyl-CoA carboxylase carboxyltransferase component